MTVRAGRRIRRNEVINSTQHALLSSRGCHTFLNGALGRAWVGTLEAAAAPSSPSPVIALHCRWFTTICSVSSRHAADV
ncbi:hypothetical protein XOCgx_1072 [Xanthomonas oryzae pv. oryzicola]|nr:hypothetical protein XOCgx_1072 [Xanthomonas oryzae pv. oryzicola]